MREEGEEGKIVLMLPVCLVVEAVGGCSGLNEVAVLAFGPWPLLCLFGVTGPDDL